MSGCREERDSQGNGVAPEEVAYILYMRSSYENIQLHDRVAVVASDLLSTHSDQSSRRVWTRSGPLEGMYFDDHLKRFPGTVTKVQ